MGKGRKGNKISNILKWLSKFLSSIRAEMNKNLVKRARFRDVKSEMKDPCTTGRNGTNGVKSNVAILQKDGEV